MKKVLFVLFLCCTYTLQAQHAVVAADKMNVLYSGVDNPVQIAVENCSCKNVAATVTNGNLTGEGCHYIFRSDNIGRAVITARCKTGGKTGITAYEFRLRQVPPPKFCIGLYCSSSVLAIKEILAAQEYIRAEHTDMEFSIPNAPVDSFRVTISSDSASATYYNTSNKISEKIRAAFLQLRSNDLVVFDNIYVTAFDGKQREIEGLLLRIK